MSHHSEYELNHVYNQIKGSVEPRTTTVAQYNMKPLKNNRRTLTCYLLYGFILFVSLAGIGFSIFSYLELQKVQNLLKEKEIKLHELNTLAHHINATNVRKINNIRSTLEIHNNTITESIISLQSSLNMVNNHIDNAVNMVTYIRWGHNTCPSGRTTVYSGRVGGTSYEHQGGASNQVCLPEDPQYYSSFRSGFQGHSIMYGSEYEQPLSSNAATQDNVPCAVCSVTTRQQVLMIPARHACPSGWTREYNGYLMSDHLGNYRSSFICVDYNQIPIPGTRVHNPATDLYHVEADCSNLPCGPYSSEKELTCVVCTK